MKQVFNGPSVDSLLAFFSQCLPIFVALMSRDDSCHLRRGGVRLSAHTDINIGPDLCRWTSVRRTGRIPSLQTYVAIFKYSYDQKLDY